MTLPRRCANGTESENHSYRNEVNPMQPVAVESDMLATVAYDARREILQLEFRDGAVYQYFALPAYVHEALLHASSKGRYFNSAIRGKFSYAPIPALCNGGAQAS
jgi:KTSC domain